MPAKVAPVDSSSDPEAPGPRAAFAVKMDMEPLEVPVEAPERRYTGPGVPPLQSTIEKCKHKARMWPQHENCDSRTSVLSIKCDVYTILDL